MAFSSKSFKNLLLLSERETNNTLVNSNYSWCQLCVRRYWLCLSSELEDWKYVNLMSKERNPCGRPIDKNTVYNNFVCVCTWAWLFVFKCLCMCVHVCVHVRICVQVTGGATLRCPAYPHQHLHFREWEAHQEQSSRPYWTECGEPNDLKRWNWSKPKKSSRIKFQPNWAWFTWFTKEKWRAGLHLLGLKNTESAQVCKRPSFHRFHHSLLSRTWPLGEWRGLPRLKPCERVVRPERRFAPHLSTEVCARRFACVKMAENQTVRQSELIACVSEGCTQRLSFLESVLEEGVERQAEEVTHYRIGESRNHRKSAKVSLTFFFPTNALMWKQDFSHFLPFYGENDVFFSNFMVQTYQCPNTNCKEQTFEIFFFSFFFSPHFKEDN